jgi:ABC-type nitrate/sulfonate/bicarbonate transport system substrate-binding protein
MNALSTLWYTRCPALTASSLAIAYGWLEREFEKDGIEVLSLLQSATRDTRESHFSHSQPNSFRHGGNIPPIWARSNGGDTRVIGLTWSETPYFVLTLPESGIRSAADLKHKRVALPRRLNDSIDFARAMYLRVYEQALGSAGLSLRDVEVVDLPVQQGYLDDSSAPSRDGALWNAAQLRGFQRTEILALLKGQVDAIPSSGFWGAENAAGLGVRTVFDSRSTADSLARFNSGNPLILSVNGSLVDERSDLVTRWIACLLRAARWGRANPSDTVRIAAKESGVAEAFVEITAPEGLDAHLDISLSGAVVASLEAQKDYLLDRGFIQHDFDVQKWIAREPLEQALRQAALEPLPA